jgi:ascorbate-specific PTS system EIIC-type component UlaA
MIPVNKPGKNLRFLSWFGFLMAMAYLILGFYVLIGSNNFNNVISGNYKTILGLILIAYGTIRLWRAFKEMKASRDQG